MPDIAYFPVYDGVFIKTAGGGDPRVFYIRGGQKCYVPTPAIAAGLMGANWTAYIEQVSGDWFNAVPNGPNETGAQGPVPVPAPAAALGWRTPFLFKYDYSELNNNGANHIETFLRLYPTGQIIGQYNYDNDDLMGFCGGIVVGVTNAANQLLQYFTPPSGCINGKLPGNAITRAVPWGDQVGNGNLAQAEQLRVAAYPTQGEGVTIGQITDAAQKLGVQVAAVLAAAGGGGGG
jgi:hypothetical protein